MREQCDMMGHFGEYGGRYVAETLMPALIELEKAYNEAKSTPEFMLEFRRLLADYVGRPSPLYFAERLTKTWDGAKIYLKREDLNHTGAHKVNNTLGQALLARRMGKKRLMAETGAGQHGVATATVAALFGMECIVYMGEEDIVRQEPNVKRMKLLKGNSPRIIFRKTNRYIIAQYVESKEAQDSIILGVNSKDLLKYDWPKEAEGSLKSITASYLTGFLAGKKILSKKLKNPIIDFGINSSIHKTKGFAFIKGLIDAGIKIKSDEKTFPSKERIEGQHMKNKIPFAKIKESIEGGK